ncbi:uncharacterized protein LOC115636947 isoform X5 [Gopherus evgoodei]|uniref:uncharacterized protein LOC115636947 isoform X5 n=1 Tax=Gopherus evgoodei TaxID=1825980 RepID=UPI0011CF0D04|nr:uncharacterized protein LOC115636947 isoform X5 [Gopherus evgoodei]
MRSASPSTCRWLVESSPECRKGWLRPTPDPLFSPPNETADLPLPNLTPRHQELIPTPCGPIKPWSELSSPVKIYFCVTILSLLSVIGLTTETLFQQTHEDFTISLIQLIGVVFCVYYVTRGILQENRQELIVFILSILLVMFRSIVNFTVVSAEQKPNVLARFILILLVGSFDVICAIILIQSQSMMAFRVGGALESLQSQYFMLNLCFSMLTFDLQAQVIRHWGQELSYALEAAVIIGSCISVAIKSVLFWALLHIYHSFGQGLRERMFSSYGRIDS